MERGLCSQFWGYWEVELLCVGGAAAGERSEWRVLVSQTRVVLLLGYARGSARAEQEQMLHRREILTAAGESLCALRRKTLNNQEVVVDLLIPT